MGELQLAEAIARADKEAEQRHALQEELTLVRSKTNLRSTASPAKPQGKKPRPQAPGPVDLERNSSRRNSIEEPGPDSRRHSRRGSQEALPLVAQNGTRPKTNVTTAIEKLSTMNIDMDKPQLVAKAVTEVVSLPKIRQLDDENLSTALESASANHEKQLARLLELQRGFVRSTHIDNNALESIRRNKNIIRSKQAAAEKRRELAKRAVAAQNDEEMFHALFENVHEDVRFQKGQVEKAKTIIKRLKDENTDIAEEFERERATLLASMREQSKQMQLLDAIIDKIQPTVKRDCNYANIDKIKKQAVWDEENQCWKMPQLMLMSSRDSGVSGPGVQSGKTQLSSRQQQLLGERSRKGDSSRDNGSYASTNEPFGTVARPRPRRLRPLGDDADDF